MGFEPLINHLDSGRNRYFGPTQLGRIDINLRGWAGFTDIDRVEVGRHLLELFPVLGLPDHQAPVNSGFLEFLWFTIRGNPEAVPRAVMNHHAFHF